MRNTGGGMKSDRHRLQWHQWNGDALSTAREATPSGRGKAESFGGARSNNATRLSRVSPLQMQCSGWTIIQDLHPVTIQESNRSNVQMGSAY